MKINGKKIIAGVVSSALLAGMLPTSVFATDLDLQQAVQRQLTAQSIDSLTIQPGETSASINLNWYAPEGTTNSVLQFAADEDVQRLPIFRGSDFDAALRRLIRELCRNGCIAI